MNDSRSTLAFDVYGTLVDPHGMQAHLARFFGAQAKQASEIWRDKQIEYSFRRALMKRYVDFDACTAQALVYVSEWAGVALSGVDREELLARYRALPAFPDAAAALSELAARGHNLVAFSNGTENAVRGLLDHAGLLEHFRTVISVDDVKSFKPDPAVYAYLAQRVGLPGSSVCLISSNPFDVVGGKAAGLNAAWIKRNTRAVFDPWDIEPDLIAKDLDELAETIDPK